MENKNLNRNNLNSLPYKALDLTISFFMRLNLRVVKKDPMYILLRWSLIYHRNKPLQNPNFLFE